MYMRRLSNLSLCSTGTIQRVFYLTVWSNYTRYISLWNLLYLSHSSPIVLFWDSIKGTFYTISHRRVIMSLFHIFFSSTVLLTGARPFRVTRVSIQYPIFTIQSCSIHIIRSSSSEELSKLFVIFRIFSFFKQLCSYITGKTGRKVYTNST